jgi:transcriptional regulator with XRE-family HTH domain
MNQIERLRDELVGRFPDLAVELDAPADERGPWFLDVRRPGDLPPVVVEWRPDRGFGVSTPGGDDFGAGPDEVYPNARAALDRVVRLVLSGGRSEPPQAVRLAALRQLRGLSQGELAERAGVGQANVSRIEGRDDLKVSTLAAVVEALGGSLVLLARFTDGTERELEIGRRPGSLAAEAEPEEARPRHRPTKRRRPARAKALVIARTRRKSATSGAPVAGA